ncbi:hypothetical protein BLNAU_16861 [Blattamonas nauphoetae]|uniref:Uncharacterized protein n=1 Tax=Blattamonas nauphoetae TaxID=2049346 RepID=A0ABQ9XAF4_9EUKA|nr:hypothetical protein BLNAU_16861 [Blattamonas nauphoetae]
MCSEAGEEALMDTTTASFARTVSSLTSSRSDRLTHPQIDSLSVTDGCSHVHHPNTTNEKGISTPQLDLKET